MGVFSPFLLLLFSVLQVCSFPSTIREKKKKMIVFFRASAHSVLNASGYTPRQEKSRSIKKLEFLGCCRLFELLLKKKKNTSIQTQIHTHRHTHEEEEGKIVSMSKAANAGRCRH